MRKFGFLFISLVLTLSACSRFQCVVQINMGEKIVLTAMADNAVRVQYIKESTRQTQW